MILMMNIYKINNLISHLELKDKNKKLIEINLRGIKIIKLA